MSNTSQKNKEKMKNATPLPNPNKLLYDFLKENNLKLKLTTTEQEENPFDGSGFLLTDKPVLKIIVEYGV